MDKRIGIGTVIVAATAALVIGVGIGSQTTSVEDAGALSQLNAVTAQGAPVEMVLNGTICTVWWRDTWQNPDSFLASGDPTAAYSVRPHAGPLGVAPADCDTTIHLPVELLNL